MGVFLKPGKMYCTPFSLGQSMPTYLLPLRRRRRPPLFAHPKDLLLSPALSPPARRMSNPEYSGSVVSLALVNLRLLVLLLPN